MNSTYCGMWLNELYGHGKNGIRKFTEHIKNVHYWMPNHALVSFAIASDHETNIHQFAAIGRTITGNWLIINTEKHAHVS